MKDRGDTLRKLVLQPYVLFCALPWVLPAYREFFPRRVHPDADYIFNLKLALLWTLLVTAPGLVLAIRDFVRGNRSTSVVSMLSAIGFLFWFPWDAFTAILKL